MGTAVYDASGQLVGIRRAPAAIYSAINALTAAQKTAIWNDFTAGNPPRWALDDGANAGAIGIGFSLVTSLQAQALLTPAQITDLKLRAVVAYVLDNPQYLTQPSFTADPTVNVPGYTAGTADTGA